MSEILRRTNADCRRPFYVSAIGGQMPGSKEPEEIFCPHCRTEVERRSSNGYFQTAALSAENESEYLINSPPTRVRLVPDAGARGARG